MHKISKKKSPQEDGHSITGCLFDCRCACAIIFLCFRWSSLWKQAATYLCPAIFPWVDMGPATEESGMVVLKLVGVFYVLIIVFDVLLVFVSSESSTFVYILLYALLIAVIVVLGAISRKPQNKWVPFSNL